SLLPRPGRLGERRRLRRGHETGGISAARFPGCGTAYRLQEYRAHYVRLAGLHPRRPVELHAPRSGPRTRTARLCGQSRASPARRRIRWRGERVPLLAGGVDGIAFRDYAVSPAARSTCARRPCASRSRAAAGSLGRAVAATATLAREAAGREPATA